jgi:xanthine dehydrogenase YagR molybdenum-binding subunit
MAEDTKTTNAPNAAPTTEPPVPRAARQQGGDTTGGPKTDTIQVPVGIYGVDMKTAERKTKPGEPPPLPPNAELKVIGKPTPRIDGRAKVTGAAKYSADVKLPGMLYAALITADVPRAKILHIDTSQAEKHPGVKAVHLLDRLVGAAEVKDANKKEDTKFPEVRFAGQPIGAIAATSQRAADEAVRLVLIDYEQLPFVVDPKKAQEKDAPLVYQGEAVASGSAGGGGGARDVKQTGNVRGPALGGSFGRDRDKANDALRKAFAESDLVLDLKFSTQVQTHSPLETHGLVADFKPDLLTVHASTQGTASVRDELASVFGLPKSKVRVLTEFMGGGFGAKFGAGNYGVLATHLSRKTGAPVRLMLTRKDEHLSVGNRPDSHQTMKLGAKKDGALTAIHLTGYGTGGVGTGAGFAGPTQRMYDCPAVLTEEYDVFTHAGPSAAFRAPGHPQGAFSIEQAVDELAARLDLDPLALRDKIDVNRPTSDVHRVQRRIGAERIGWSNRKPAGSDKGPVKRGLGVAQSVWGRFHSGDSNCQVRITQDGSVEFTSSVQDIGGGIKTALAQVVAEELGLAVADVTVRTGDTNYPIGPNSGGSVTTNSITPAARNAAYQARRQFLAEIAAPLNAKPDDLVIADGKVTSKTNPSLSVPFRNAAAKMKVEEVAARVKRSDEYSDANGERVRDALGGVHFCQVAVDTETGMVKVEKFVAVHDCGRPINPLGLVSQINGGIIQGISYALYENRILDRNTGLMVNPNLEEYKIAGSRETPPIDVVLVEEYIGASSTDAAGIGEPATVPTAACLANAVYNAIGVRVTDLPITPAKVLAALKNKAVAQT